MHLGLGLSLGSLTRPPWSPGALFQPGNIGALIDPARMDLLAQDAAGASPLTAPGQPVGLVRRAAGTLDAAQSVAAARPTLARWPRGGVRNLIVGAQAVETITRWIASGNEAGLNATKSGYGFEDGEPYVDYMLSGTPTGTVATLAGFSLTSGVATGDEYAAQVTARIISGAGVEARLAMLQRGPAGSISAHTSARLSASTDMSGVITASVTDPAVTHINMLVQILFTTGTKIDAVVRFKGWQLEKAATPSRVQHNRGMADITEPGVPDVWHLWDDGVDDALPLALPAGTYTAAWADPLGTTTITAGLDATAAADVLRGERVAGALVINRALTSTEQAQLTAHWAQIGGAA